MYAAIRMAKKHGMTVVFDPSPIPKEPFPQDIIRMIDFTKPNEIEAAQLAGIKITDIATAEACLESLLTAGFSAQSFPLARRVALRLLAGKIRGSRRQRYRRLTVRLRAMCFRLVYSGAVQGLSLYEAIRFASVASALSTTVKGRKPLYQGSPRWKKYGKSFQNNNDQKAGSAGFFYCFYFAGCKPFWPEGNPEAAEKRTVRTSSLPRER